jgi:hypothetical protein
MLIELRGKYAIGAHRFAIVDDYDFEFVNQWKWKAKWNGARNNVYAVRNLIVEGKTITIRLNRLIAERHGQVVKEGMVVDFLNHNTLDCRSQNLQVTTQCQNMNNSQPKIREVICVICGCLIQQVAPILSGRRIYCSDRCKDNVKRTRKKLKRQPVKNPSLRCLMCDSKFTPTFVQSPRKKQTFCSDVCRNKHKTRLRRGLPVPHLVKYLNQRSLSGY